MDSSAGLLKVRFWYACCVLSARNSVVYETHSQRRRAGSRTCAIRALALSTAKWPALPRRGCHNGRSRRRKLIGRATRQHELGFECGHVLLWLNGTFGVSHRSSTDSDRTSSNKCNCWSASGCMEAIRRTREGGLHRIVRPIHLRIGRMDMANPWAIRNRTRPLRLKLSAVLK
jgi:hypothetical protein